MTANAPIVQLTFYPDAILCTRYDAHGQITYPVAPQEVAEAVADVTFSTGWLPPQTRFVERRGGISTVAIHVPQGRHRVHVQTAEGAFQWSVPMPDLLFIGRGTTYRVFATKTTPTPDVPLFHAPCPNVHDYGGICAGNTPFPEAAPASMLEAFGMFMSGSVFNQHLCQNRVTGCARANVLTLWEHLATRPRARFPLRYLRPFPTTIAGVLR
jgi:PRTRC genetic system protein B